MRVSSNPGARGPDLQAPGGIYTAAAAPRSRPETKPEAIQERDNDLNDTIDEGPGCSGVLFN